MGRVWLKAVPDFFAHEGAVIDWIGVPVAPRLIDFAPGRALIADIAGELNHEVRKPAALRPMVELLTGLQQRCLDRLDELIAIGVPGRRLETMVPRIAGVVEQWGSGLDRSERRSVDALVAALPARLAAVEECGVPDTLVHGDFHPGNVAGRPGDYVILDWGDSFVGHPLIDELAFVERLSPSTQAAARDWFVSAWKGTCLVLTPLGRPTCWSRWSAYSPRSCTPASARASNPTSASTTHRMRCGCSARPRGRAATMTD